MRQYEKEEKMIQSILDNFDFDKCHKTMKFLNWSWGFDYQVPTIERLKSSAVERLKSAMDGARKAKCSKSTFFSSSGGLKGTAWVNRFGQVEGIRLEFVLTDWDDDGDV